MKIRIDFVTNSSSYNSCVIRIDNPVLEKLLQKYKQESTFRQIINEYVCKDGFAYNDDRIETADVYFVPKSIDTVAEDLLSVLCGHNFMFSPDEKLIPLYQDIISNKKEILSGYNSVVWQIKSNDYGESGFKNIKNCFKWEKEGMHTINNIDPQNVIFEGRIFVLTGLNESEEAKAAQLIAEKGGIVKSSTVLATNYLIINPAYGYKTKKYIRAMELIQKGYQIFILPIDDFLKCFI